MTNYVLTLEDSSNFLNEKVYTDREAALMDAFALATQLEVNIAVRKFGRAGQLGQAEDIVEG